jgi:hypothetical protein
MIKYCSLIVFVIILFIVVFNLANKSKKKRKIPVKKIEEYEEYRESIPADAKALIKLFGELTESDFEQYPVWVSCHLIDYNQPWYDETHEEHFRPWFGEIPVNPRHMTFLVKSTLTLADGTIVKGFITPIEEIPKDVTKALGKIQPQILHSSGKLISFWYGLLRPSEDTISKQYELLGKTSDQVFPIRFEPERELTKGIVTGVIPGFCYFEYTEGDKNIKVIK